MMSPDRKRLARLRSDERGATAVEYGLILAILVLAAMAAMTFMSTRVNGMWDMVSNRVTSET